MAHPGVDTTHPPHQALTPEWSLWICPTGSMVRYIDYLNHYQQLRYPCGWLHHAYPWLHPSIDDDFTRLSLARRIILDN
eukprot:scaffold34733_cov30-Attheya_sp.AAC.9